MLQLSPGTVSLRVLETIYRGAEPLCLDPAARAGVEEAARMVAKAAEGAEWRGKPAGSLK